MHGDSLIVQQSVLSTSQCASGPAAQGIEQAGTAYVKQGELKSPHTYKELNTGMRSREWEIHSKIMLNAGN